MIYWTKYIVNLNFKCLLIFIILNYIRSYKKKWDVNLGSLCYTVQVVGSLIIISKLVILLLSQKHYNILRPGSSVPVICIANLAGTCKKKAKCKNLHT